MEINHPFRGYALNAVDAKGRVSVPAAFRDLIAVRCATYAPGDVSVDDKQLGIVISEEMDRLVAYDAIGDRQQARDLRDSLADLPAAERRKALADLGRGEVGGTTPVSFDSAGRLVLPQTVRSLAGIGDLALFWGNIDFFEIWDPARAREAFASDRRNRAILDALLKEKGIAL
ncbi:division/cell wall cluster transcriptional repressor MraZ [Sphingomonas bacterium]|uniref:division/cell wall cluster transcriptional repressor MraZ n=1 Tax=Sphingomonas bacterium TaxID=1895847 RepID=UPI00157769B3|nr:hypothetical protein [Sphingomonas bacterium]